VIRHASPRRDRVRGRFRNRLFRSKTWYRRSLNPTSVGSLVWDASTLSATLHSVRRGYFHLEAGPSASGFLLYAQPLLLLLTTQDDYGSGNIAS
jgi:hypothetical protein